MFDKDNLVKQIIRRDISIVLVITGMLYIGFKNPKPYILGMIFGTSIGILNFLLLSNTVKKAILMEPEKAYGYTMGNYIVRYIIYFVVLLIAALADYINLVTTILGLLMIKIVIVFGALLDTISETIKRKTKQKYDS